MSALTPLLQVKNAGLVAESVNLTVVARVTRRESQALVFWVPHAVDGLRVEKFPLFHTDF